MAEKYRIMEEGPVRQRDGTILGRVHIELFNSEGGGRFTDPIPETVEWTLPSWPASAAAFRSSFATKMGTAYPDATEE